MARPVQPYWLMVPEITSGEQSNEEGARAALAVASACAALDGAQLRHARDRVAAADADDALDELCALRRGGGAS